MKKIYLFRTFFVALFTCYSAIASYSNTTLLDDGDDTIVYPPGKVTNVTYTVSEISSDNCADVTINFIAPTDHIIDSYGYSFSEGLDEISLIEVTQYENYTDNIVSYIENVGVGEEVSMILKDQKPGYKRYKITCYNSGNIGLSQTKNDGTWGYNKAYYEIAVQVGPYPPGRPTELSAVSSKPNEDGTANVTIKFIAPTTHFTDEYGNTLEEGLDNITKIEITEYGYPVYTLHHTIDNAVPGQEYEVLLENQTSGNKNYYVTAYNNANIEYSTTGSNPSGNYKSQASISIYVGYDTPNEVENLTYNYDGTNVVLTWDMPSKSSNGGYMLTETIVYDVYRHNEIDYSNEKIAEEIAETTFTDVLTLDSPTKVYYRIVPKSMKDGKLEEGRSKQTGSFVVGPAVKLPFKESFVNGQVLHLWSNTNEGWAVNMSTSSSDVANGGWGTSTPFNTKVENTYDLDGGMLSFNSYGYNTGYYIYTTCPISLDATENPVLSFYEWREINENNNAKIELLIAREGEDFVVLDTYDNYKSGESGWVKHEYSLKDYIGEKPISFGFKAYSDKQTIFAAFDAIVLKDVYDYDLMINSITAPAKVESGERFDVITTVENNGLLEIDLFDVVLYRNGEEISRTAAGPLQSNEQQIFTFPNTAHNSYADETIFKVVIESEKDMNVSNNSSEEVITLIEKAITPEVTVVNAEYVEPNKVTLTWETPDYSLPAPATVTDGFEDYADWAPADPENSQLAGSVGDWLIINNNTSYKGNLDGKGNNYYTDHNYSSYPGQYASPAFQVINTTTLGVTDKENSGYWAPRTGEKCMVSVDVSSYMAKKEDWLISPKLSGKAQTVKFYAQTYNTGNGSYPVYQQIMVYGSTAGNTISEFNDVLIGLKDEYGYEYPIDITQVACGSDGYNPNYQEVTVEIPEGTTYFAIKCCNSGSTSFLMIDDVTYEEAIKGIPVQLIGFNVYCDGVKVNNEPITGNTYDVDILYGATHSYSIETVYDKGESIQSVPVEVSAPELILPAVAIEGEITDNNVVLTWAAPVVDENKAPVEVEKYEVYRDGEKVAETAELTYTDTLNEYAQYTYAVKVIYDKGESELSNEVVLEYLEVVLPAVYIIGSLTDNIVSLTWSVPEIPEGKAPVEVKCYAVYCNNEIVATPEETSVRIDIEEDGSYVYAVQVIYDKGESELSNEYTVEYTGIGIIDSEAQDLNVYSVSGLLIKRNASWNEIKEFEPGIYIINGKKVLVK